MEGITLALSLGAAVVKSATKLWLGDRPIAADVSVSAVDILVGRASGVLEKRKTQRLFDQLEEVVSERLEPLLEREFRHLEDNERAAAIEAVRETLDRVALTDEDLFAADLDSAYVNRYVRRAVPGMPGRYQLSEAGHACYDRVLVECCACLVQLTTTLPRFQIGVLTELLRRETATIDLVREVLKRLPDRRNADDLEADYRQQVDNALDRMQLFGARVSKANRKYPLSVAYLSLTMSERSGSLRADALLADKTRLLIRGEAGSGKTTLLQWIAVTRARDRSALPFFVRLRRYAVGSLPTPELFLDEVGRHIADEMPAGWVQQALRSGRAVVLIDGVDELPEERRPHVQAWLGELIAAFPAARYVVTTRPMAVEADWLEEYDFAVAELQPMTPADVRTFVHRWHEAMRSQVVDQDDVDELDWLEAQLIDAIAERRALRRLSENPLMCALLCAMHREQRGEIPDSRMELYDTTLTILLESREKERGLVPTLAMSRTEQLVLLWDLAYWMVRNDVTDAPRIRVVEQLGKRLSTMAHGGEDPRVVYRYLLERTGLLREAVVGRVDFVHRTFQEYLAAKAAVEADDIGSLIDHAHLEPWHEVVVMAAGHASRQQRDELLKGLLRKRIGKRSHRDQLDLLAVACLETSPDLNPKLREEIQQRTARLLPPRDDETALILGRAGEFVLDLLARSMPSEPAEVAATIRAAAHVGGDSAMHVIARLARDSSFAAKQAVFEAWDRFDSETYLNVVLGDSLLDIERLVVSSASQLAGLGQLPNLRTLECELTFGLWPHGFQVELPRLTKLVVRNHGSLGAVPQGPGIDFGAGLLLNSALTYLPNLRTLEFVGHPDVLAIQALAEFQKRGVDLPRTSITVEQPDQ